MPVRIITCGGTFDMTAFGASDSFYGTSAAVELVRRMRCAKPVTVKALMQVDSALMTDAHRAAIAAEIKASLERHIVITHGTDTIAETAQYLRAAVIARVVVLTSAFKPALDPDSDGPANLASAITASRLLEPGVYLAAQGEIFSAGEFRKNRRESRFERI